MSEHVEKFSLEKPDIRTEISILAVNFLSIFLIVWGGLKIWIGTLQIAHFIAHVDKWTFDYGILHFLWPIGLTSFVLRKRVHLRPWLIGVMTPCVVYIAGATIFA